MPAVRLRGLALLGDHHRPDDQPEVSLQPVRTVHPCRYCRAERRDPADPLVLLHPHCRRPQYHIPHDGPADHSRGGHRLPAAGSGHTAVAVPGHGAAVGLRRRQLRVLDVEHLVLLPEERAGLLARHERRARQFRRHHDADPGPPRHDGRGLRRLGAHPRQQLGHAGRKDTGGNRDLHPQRRLHLGCHPDPPGDRRLVRHEQHHRGTCLSGPRLDHRRLRQDPGHAGRRARHRRRRPVAAAAGKRGRFRARNQQVDRSAARDRGHGLCAETHSRSPYARASNSSTRSSGTSTPGP